MQELFQIHKRNSNNDMVKNKNHIAYTIDWNMKTFVSLNYVYVRI